MLPICGTDLLLISWVWFLSAMKIRGAQLQRRYLENRCTPNWSISTLVIQVFLTSEISGSHSSEDVISSGIWVSQPIEYIHISCHCRKYEWLVCCELIIIDRYSKLFCMHILVRKVRLWLADHSSVSVFFQFKWAATVTCSIGATTNAPSCATSSHSSTASHNTSISSTNVCTSTSTLCCNSQSFEPATSCQP